jgi:PleD family two-component response regulator
VPDKQTLLVVDDDPNLAGMLNDYFQVQGYNVITADWGEDAVKACWDTPPHLALLDIHLPDIDGYEVARRLHAHRRTKDIPLIFLTQKSERRDRLQGLALGAVDYITKPFDLSELELRVRNTLQRTFQKTLAHPVTGLPTGRWVDETLSDLPQASGWAVLLASLRGLDQFRERYGFVAADDVLRAVGLILKDLLEQSHSRGEVDFVGHLTAEDFFIVTSAERVADLRDRIDARLARSMEYFYPLKDRLAASPMRDPLSINLSVVTATESTAKDVDALKVALLRSRSH